MTAIGKIETVDGGMVLKVSGSNKAFLLGKHTEEQDAAASAKSQSNATIASRGSLIIRAVDANILVLRGRVRPTWINTAVR